MTSFSKLGRAIIVFAAIGSAPALADFYGTNYDPTNATFYTINSTTGVATTVGLTGIGNPIGLALSPSGTLYTSTYAGSLYTIDKTTGAAMLVGSSAITAPEGDIAFSPNGTLYLVNSGPDALYTVNTTTGAETLVGSMGAAGRDVSGLVFSGNSLYGVALNNTGTNTLVSIDTTSGAATTIGATGTSFVTALAAIAATPGQVTLEGDNALYSLDLSTAVATKYATISGVTGTIAGLAPIVSAVPEPMSIASIAVGAGLLALRRRRAI